MKHSILAAILVFATSNCLAHSQTHNNYVFNKSAPWHLIVSLGAGVAISPSDTSQSTTFPIMNPITDEFFVYGANNATQTTRMADAFVGAEFVLRSRWLMQIGLGYNQSWNFDAKGSLYQGADVQSADLYSYHYSILGRQLMIESKFLYQYRDRYLPYLFLGLGAAFSQASGYDTNIPPFLTFTRIYQNHTQTSLAYAIGAGIDVDIRDNLRLGAGYRFANLGEVQLGSAVIDTTSVSGTLPSTHLYANEIFAQATWII